MKKLNVPYYSQQLDVLDPEWKWRSCGICALKMAMEFLGSKTNLDELVKEGLAVGAYLNGIGWIHQGLVDIAKRHGFLNSFKKEWPIRQLAEEKEKATEYLTESLNNNIPVLASVKSISGGHLVLLVGLEKKGFYIHDPDAHNREDGEFKFLNLSKFLEIWKGRIIVLK